MFPRYMQLTLACTMYSAAPLKYCAQWSLYKPAYILIQRKVYLNFSSTIANKLYVMCGHDVVRSVAQKQMKFLY